MEYEGDQKYQAEFKKMYLEELVGTVQYKYPVRLMICGGCGKEFYTQNKHKKYCCYDCLRLGTMKLKKNKALKARENRVCACCGKAFTPTRSDGRFCSNACRQKMYRRKGVTDVGADTKYPLPKP